MSITSPGMSISGRGENSCSIRLMGKIGCKSSGPIGWRVPGWSGGSSGSCKDGSTLTHAAGTCPSFKVYFVISDITVGISDCSSPPGVSVCQNVNMAEPVILIANGDLRLAANQRCWAAQARAEEAVMDAIRRQGRDVGRGHACDSVK